MSKGAENLRPSGDIERQTESIARRLQLSLSFAVTFIWNNRGEFNIKFT